MLGIIDSQSVKWGNNQFLNGVDSNNKVKGIKRHIIVDKNGFLIAVMVTIANIHDSKTAYLLMRGLKELVHIKNKDLNLFIKGGSSKEL